jgi:hypothetical protein
MSVWENKLRIFWLRINSTKSLEKKKSLSESASQNLFLKKNNILKHIFFHNTYRKRETKPVYILCKRKCVKIFLFLKLFFNLINFFFLGYPTHKRNKRNKCSYQKNPLQAVAVLSICEGGAGAPPEILNFLPILLWFLYFAPLIFLFCTTT